MLGLLECPSCSGRLKKNERVCECQNCGRSYKYYPEIGIIDFLGSENNFSAAEFDQEEDRRRFQFLLSRYNEHGYLGLQSIYNAGCKKDILMDMPTCSNPPDLSHGIDSIKKINALIRKQGIDIDGSGCILENGCGHGYFAYEFATSFARTIIADCSLSYLLLASKFIDSCTMHQPARRVNEYLLIRADSMRLPIREGSISVIHSNNVIEHVSNQYQ